MHSPLEQFRIVSHIPLQIAGVDVSFTNASTAMVLVVLVIFGFGWISARRTCLVPHTCQNLAEALLELMEGVLVDNAGPKARPFLPFVFSLFLFVLMANLLGLLPWQFTITSHIVVTFTLASLVFLTVVLVGLWRHGWHFFSLFWPSGTPLALAPLVIPVELMSFLSRPVSLSIRLFANMMAGHTILKVFATFVVMMGLWGFVPLVLTVILTGFELAVSVVQAYIFSVLACVYLRDAIELH